jgi:predicted dehydrogenase
MSGNRKKVAVLGLGMMGNTHIAAWLKREDVELVAVSDPNPKRLSGETRAEGNIDSFSDGGFDFSAVAKYEDFRDAVRDENVEVVDICLPTLFHVEAAKLCAELKKPFLLEKPIARTAAGAREIAKVVEEAGILAMPSLVLRFWPGWKWLKEQIDAGTYGRVLSARFERIGSCPGGRFYGNGKLSGGALLDLHIHDTDFVLYCFGEPAAVTSYGYPRMSGEIDHVVTHYHFEDGPMVVAEGGWLPKNNLPFRMGYMVNFEDATAVFDLNADPPLQVFREGEEPEAIPLPDESGFDLEIADFMSALYSGEPPKTATFSDGLASAIIADAERESIRQGQPVKLEF